MYTRQCANCEFKLFYCTKKTFSVAVRNNSKCKKCIGISQRRKNLFTRNCPRCDRLIEYQTTKNCKRAIEKKSFCKNCAMKKPNPLKGTCRSEITKHKCRIGNLGKKRSVESRQKMSESRATGIANGTIKTNRFCKRSIYFSTKSNEIFYADSMLEKFYMTLLDADSNILTWTKRHKIKIPYIVENIIRNYVPDFFITFKNDSCAIHEVKGIEDDISRIKHKVLLEYCINNNFQQKWITTQDLVSVGFKLWRKENK